MKIEKSVHSIGQNFFSIDQKSEEIIHKISAWFDWYSIPVQLIEKNIQLIERNSWLIETRETEFF